MVSIIGVNLYAIAFASHLAMTGIEVCLTDLDEELMKSLEDDLPGYEAELDDYFHEAKKTKRLILCDPEKAIEKNNLIMITYEAPENDESIVDLRFIKNACNRIVAKMKEDKAIVLMQPVPPHTTEEIQKYMQNSISESDKALVCEVMFLPPYAETSTLIQDLKKPQNIVLGSNASWGTQKILKLFSKMRIIPSKITIAKTGDVELSTYAERGLMAVNRAYFNDVAWLTDKLGLDINEVQKLMMKNKERVYKPSIGLSYGDGNLPKAIRELHTIAKKVKIPFPVVDGAIKAKPSQTDLFIKKIRHLLGGVKGKTIGVFGLTEKGGTDALREVPAIDIIKYLVSNHANVRLYCAEEYTQAKWRFYAEREKLTFCNHILSVAEGADTILVLGKTEKANNIDLKTLRRRMKGDLFIDGARLFAQYHEINKIFNYHSLGGKGGNANED